ncbi:MAG: heme exporter protein CcmD [Halioglobus sp.]|nr:heme exporter protein CcmD [Halioglobus sp.]
MFFDSLQSALYMDGHGLYVWVAYLVTLLVIIVVIAVPVRQRKRLLLQLAVQGRRAAGPVLRREED